MAKNKPSPDVVRRNLSSDLISLSQILQNHTNGIVLNADVLMSSANSVKREKQGATWSYAIDALRISVDAPQNTLPGTCTSPLSIQIDLELRGSCDVDPADCLTHLVLDLLITSDSGDYLCAWHLDRDVGQMTPSFEAHPLYHFQHGGHAMEAHASSLGRLLLLPAPRIAFPPMDAVLAIDFVLSNFAGTCWQHLRSEPTYLRLLQEAQNRYWKPYLNRLVGWWEPGPKSKAAINALWPQLA